ncbi:MAG: hypothetical protein AAF731_20640 [Bacteroidota bacterium]
MFKYLPNWIRKASVVYGLSSLVFLVSFFYIEDNDFAKATNVPPPEQPPTKPLGTEPSSSFEEPSSPFEGEVKTREIRFELTIAIVGTWLGIVQLSLEYNKNKREIRRENFEIIQNLVSELNTNQGYRNALTLLDNNGKGSFAMPLENDESVLVEFNEYDIFKALAPNRDFLRYQTKTQKNKGFEEEKPHY